MKSIKKRRRREGRKAELEMRAMGTLHIGDRRSIGMTRGRGGRLKCIDMATQYKRELGGRTTTDKGTGEGKTRLR